MAIIFSFSSIEGPEIPPIENNIDKLFHLVEYFILGALLARAFSKTAAAPNYLYIFIFSMLIASAFGATDEFHQRFVPGRECDVFDFLFDAIGAGIGAALYAYKERGINAVDKSV